MIPEWQDIAPTEVEWDDDEPPNLLFDPLIFDAAIFDAPFGGDQWVSTEPASTTWTEA